MSRTNSTGVDGCPSQHLEQIAFVPEVCRTLPSASCGPTATTEIPIVSTDLTMIQGYNRGVGNDFPRIAVSDSKGTVSIDGKTRVPTPRETFFFKASGSVVLRRCNSRR